MRGLYRFYVDCGRMGDLSGLFVADSDHIDAIIGQDVYFGEVLGKHSDVMLCMKPEMFTLVTNNQEFLDDCDKYIGDVASGYNPFDYWEPDTDNFDADEGE